MNAHAGAASAVCRIADMQYCELRQLEELEAAAGELRATGTRSAQIRAARLFALAEQMRRDGVTCPSGPCPYVGRPQTRGRGTGVAGPDLGLPNRPRG